jgi:hypothetical protein
MKQLSEADVALLEKLLLGQLPEAEAERLAADKPWRLASFDDISDAEGGKQWFEKNTAGGYGPVFGARYRWGANVGTVEIFQTDRLWGCWYGPREAVGEKLAWARSVEWTVESFSAIRLGDGFVFTAHYVGPPGPQWEYHDELSADELAGRVREYRAKDWRPRVLGIHQDRVPLRYLAMFEENAERAKWDLETGLTVAEYEKELAGRKAAGFSPRCVCSHETDGQVRYSVVWMGTTSPASPAPKLPIGDSPPAKDPFSGRTVVDSDRKAAADVLSVGGTVHVNGEDRPIKAAAELPAGPFRLTDIALAASQQGTDAGLAAFKDCKNLTRLALIDTPVSDPGVAHFDGCKHLTHLHLGGSKVTDTGLTAFKESKNLEILELGNTGNSGAGLAHFQGCKGLKQLHIGLTRVVDADLAIVKEWANLESLELRGTQVSDAGLANFKSLKNLTHIQLQKTKVTAAGIDELKKALPQCKIE